LEGLVWYYTVISLVRARIDKLHDWVRSVSLFDLPQERATDAGNNENKPEAYAALVHVWHIDDTMTMCEPSLALAS